MSRTIQIVEVEYQGEEHFAIAIMEGERIVAMLFRILLVDRSPTKGCQWTTTLAWGWHTASRREAEAALQDVLNIEADLEREQRYLSQRGHE